MNKCPTCGAPACKKCGLCHTHGGRSRVRTQKARGVKWIESMFTAMHITSRVLNATTDMECLDALMFSFPIFARPCPMKPRHGFVDSRLVNNNEELLNVCVETWAADPNGEVILMPYIDAEWNAIWTPGMLTIGAGNDGATMGKNTVQIPLLAKGYPSFSLAGIGADEWPFVEVVSDKGGHQYFVQARSGPVGTIVGNFVPKPTTVKSILYPGDFDMLAWEKETDARKGEDGLVVVHVGGSPSDHPSIHARMNDLPIIYDHYPSIGDYLSASAPLGAPDPQAVLNGIVMGSKIEFEDEQYRNLVRLMLVGLHHSLRMVGQYGFWVGVSCSILLRLGSMALRGEARHEQGRKGAKPAREAVYTKHQNRSISFHRAAIGRLLNVFKYGNFGPTYALSTSTMGGIKWAACAEALVPVFNAVRQLAQDKSPDAVKTLIKAMNIAVNQAHNGGWWFNKFSPINDFNLMADNNPTHTVTICDEVFRIHNMKVAPEELARGAARIAAWPETVDTRPPAIKTTEIDVVSGAFVVAIVPQKGKRVIRLAIPTEQMMAQMHSLLSNMKISRGEHGYIMTSKVKAQANAKVWEEPLVGSNKAF